MARDPLVQDRTPLNETKYAGRDYQSIFDALLRRLKTQYADVYNDYADSSVGVMLMDLCAYAAGMIAWTLDRVVSDCYLSTVRVPHWASMLCRQLGYKMTPAAASSVDLTLTFPDGIPNPYVMEAGWRFQGPNSLQFESVADLTLDISAVPVTYTVAVRQGETRTISFVGDGTAFQQYRLDLAGEEKTIADGSVRVWVDGAEWTEQPFLAYAATAQFEVDYHADPPLLRFGDGNAGLIPPEDADIRVLFVKIAGAAGNVKAHTITTSLDALIIGGTPVTFTIDHDLGARSGIDAETVDHARRWAPYTFAARDGAVTQLDYQALSNSFVDPLYGAVAKAYAFTPRAAYDDPEFNGFVDTLSAAVDTFMLAFTTAHAVILTDVSTINTQVGIIEAARGIIDGLRTDLINTVTSVLAGISATKAALIANTGNFSALEAAHASASNSVAALETYIEDHYTDPERAEMLAFTSNIKSQLAISIVSTNTAKIVDSMVTTQLESVVETQVLTMTPLLESGSVPNIEDQLILQADAVTATGAPLAEMANQLVVIENAADLIESTSVTQLADMQERIGELFDNSCRSNLVQVSILSVDTDGNYIAPPSGLMVALQAFLDQYKETTQFVEVIDGTTGLVAANVEIKYKALDGVVDAEVYAAIEATIRGMLRGREYNDPLYLSDVYRYVRACSDGISHVTIILSGDALDGNGDLVPTATQVLVLGTLTITELV